MKKILSLIICSTFFCGLFKQSFAAENAKSQQPRKTAIVVENRAGKEFNDKVAVLEDLLAARVAGEGFSVLSRDVVTRGLKEYPTPNSKPSTAGVPGASLDRALENSTTAQRLAQNIGADFILIPSIMTYGAEKKTYKGNGVSTVNVTHTMRVGYKLVDAGDGAAIKGATVVATKTLRQTEGSQVESSEVVNELLDDAATQLAKALIDSTSSIPAAVASADLASFSVACTMTDIKQEPITIPDVRITKDNRVVKTNNLVVSALDVTLELDGLAIGSAPGMFKARPGLHKIRLSREGFAPWERTINIYNGQSLKVALQMSAEGYNRWKDNVAFLQALDDDRKLTDAEVKVLEGQAKFLSESHYRVDTKENIKIYKSIY